MEKVLVYGTLKKGHGNHHLLGDSKLIDEGWYNCNYSMVSMGPFPALVEDDIYCDRIYGEIYEVTPEVFARLDMLEGYPNFYSRAKEKFFEVDKDHPQYIEAWVYFIPWKREYCLGTQGLEIVWSGYWE